MKIKLSTPVITKTIIVNIELHLNRTVTDIECKLFVPSMQLNLRELSTRFLIKDKDERRIRQYDYVNYTDKIVRKLANGPMRKYIKEDHTSIVWWK